MELRQCENALTATRERQRAAGRVGDGSGQETSWAVAVVRSDPTGGAAACVSVHTDSDTVIGTLVVMIGTSALCSAAL